MNRPRESLLTLFDPLYSGEPTTPPPCRDIPSPDLGSDKENAAPVSDNSITLTKFLNRIYTWPKAQAQLPRSLPKGRLIDLGNPNASDDNSDSNDDDEDGQSEHVLVVKRKHESLPTTTERKDTQGSPPRRPLADIALGDSRRSSPIAAKAASPAVGTLSSSSFFGPPSPFRPTPAPSASPLASVINAINGTTSPSPPLTPSGPRIAVTPAEPSSPSPTRRPLRPGAMLYASPDPDPRRTSVDLQESMSVHFDDSSFDLLKDKISLPENDSLDHLDMDMGTPAVKLPNKGQHEEITTTLSANADSESEPDFGDMVEERLRDLNIAEDSAQVVKNKDTDGDRDSICSTPPTRFSSCDTATPQAPVRQFLRPRNKMQVHAEPTTNSDAPPVVLPRRGSRASISSLPVPAPTTAALRIAKKAKPEMVAPAPIIPARNKAAGRGGGGGMTNTHPAPAPPRTIAFGGVQRPPAPVKVVPTTAASAPALTRMESQRSKRIASQALSTTSKVSVAGTAGSRLSGLRPPMSRGGGLGIAVPRASTAGAGSAMRPSMAVSGRLGSSGMTKTGPVKADSALATARMIRRA